MAFHPSALVLGMLALSALNASASAAGGPSDHQQHADVSLEDAFLRGVAKHRNGSDSASPDRSGCTRTSLRNPGDVNCGGHFGASCSDCASSFGAAWCRGECRWYGWEQWGWCARRAHFWLLEEAVLLWDLFHLHLLYVGLMLVFAILYERRVVQRTLEYNSFRPVTTRLRGPEDSLFSCFSDGPTCCSTWWCLPAVMGKNWELAGEGRFWPMWFLSILLFTPLFLVPVLVRLKLSGRGLLVARPSSLDGAKQLSSEVMLNLFCLPCLAGWESRQVDSLAGVRVGYCIRVEADPSSERAQRAEREAREQRWSSMFKCRGCTG